MVPTSAPALRSLEQVGSASDLKGSLPNGLCQTRGSFRSEQTVPYGVHNEDLITTKRLLTTSAHPMFSLDLYNRYNGPGELGQALLGQSSGSMRTWSRLFAILDE
jgi:hypothetical protein